MAMIHPSRTHELYEHPVSELHRIDIESAYFGLFSFPRDPRVDVGALRDERDARRGRKTG